MATSIPLSCLFFFTKVGQSYIFHTTYDHPETKQQEEMMSDSPVIRLGTETPIEFSWGVINWGMGKEIDRDAEQTFGTVCINPGQENPRHYHPNCEELLYVLTGSCKHSLGDEVFHLGQGELIRIPAGVVHNALNDGLEPLRAVISFSDGNRKTVFVEQAE